MSGGQTLPPPKWAVLFGLAAVLAVLLFSGGAQAQNASDRALVGNLAQTATGYQPFALGLAQSFTTGSGHGFVLGSLQLRLESRPSAANAPTVTLHAGSATGPKVADFAYPSGQIAVAEADYSFAATGTVTLAPYTEYWVVAHGGGA